MRGCSSCEGMVLYERMLDQLEGALHVKGWFHVGGCLINSPRVLFMRLTHMRRCIEVVLTTDLKYFLPKILLVEVVTMAIY